MRKNKEITALDRAFDLLEENGYDLQNISGNNGLLREMTKNLVERALQAELTAHLSNQKTLNESRCNSRNGYGDKKLITDNGSFDIKTPRDRNSSFEPILVPKRSSMVKGLDDKILSLYAKGMSVRDIQIQLEELYGAEVSKSLISDITDEVLEEIELWHKRPLDAVYPIVYFDCLVVKVREDKRIINKSVYIALGVNINGLKEILGLWISKNEGAKFWLSNLTELRNRGLEDILIACTDNLTGMTDAINAAYPNTEHQLCVVHQIRNSLAFVSYKDRKAVANDLKPIYTATNEEGAIEALASFKDKWDKNYPHISPAWNRNWNNLVIFLDYPEDIRRAIYTTNAIEALNNQLRKVTKNKRVFPNDNAVFKTLYLAIGYIEKKWTMPIRNWKQAMAHFIIKFEDRMKIK